MFISINKKIIYSILFFFLLTSLIFISTFYMIYGKKVQEEQLSNIQRNQSYINLLLKNISLYKELRDIVDGNKNIHISNSALKNEIFSPNNEESQIKQISIEQARVNEANRNYTDRYAAIQYSIRIVSIGALLITFFIIILWILIRGWILRPINKISAITSLVAAGEFNQRIELVKNPIFVDELDYLTKTFNQMLNNLENVIAEVKYKEAFLQALIDSIPDGIRVIDKDYNIIIANKAYYEQVGPKFSKCKKCHQASQKLNNPCPENSILCPVREIIEKEQKSVKIVQQFCAFPNRHLHIKAAPLNISQNDQYIVEAIRDLSEDINFSHQQKLSSMGFLSTSIAHEIKNHLGALRIITERLLNKYYVDKEDDCEEKKHITLIYNELLSCINIPDRLLKLSRNTSDNNQEINCQENLRDVISLLDFEAKSKGINININSPASPILITGNEADFKMLAINLILNALKATDAGGEINVELTSSNNNIIIHFKDNGVGISADKIKRIFDPFYSGYNNKEDKGNGLGLSIVKSIIEKFNGKISVHSEVNIGSCFTVSFPKNKKSCIN